MSTIADDLALIEETLIATQHDGADCGDIAEALRALERVRVMVRFTEQLSDIVSERIRA
jgi:hypothetical protein